MIEDMTLNVQSMLSSPYVRPLLNEVQSWEKKLSLMGKRRSAAVLFERKEN